MYTITWSYYGSSIIILCSYTEGAIKYGGVRSDQRILSECWEMSCLELQEFFMLLRIGLAIISSENCFLVSVAL